MTETKPENSGGFKNVGVSGVASGTTAEVKVQAGNAELKQPEVAKVVTPEVKPVEPTILDSIKEKIPSTAKYSALFFKNLVSFIVVGVIILFIGWHYRDNLFTRLDNSDISQLEVSDNDMKTDDEDSLQPSATDLATSATGPIQFGWQIGQAYLGIHYVNINPSMQQNANLPVDYGALVVAGKTPSDLAIVPGGPADRAGIVEGDIILEADNIKLDEKITTLGTVIAQKAAEEVITLKILHNGVEKTVQLTLGTSPRSDK